MRAFRGILKSDAVRRAACWLAAQYIHLVWKTGRWKVLGEEHVLPLVNEGKPGIVSFWHGRLLMMPYGWHRPIPFHMLISAHRDGELIANVVKHHGIGWVKGSTAKEGRTDKGGAQAFRTLIRALKAGEFAGMTPDGPRGPRMRASDGIITLARMSGAPILPLTYGVERGKVLGSWDRFLVAMPFSKGVLYWGEPIYVARDADAETLEAKRLELETRLNAMTAEADAMTGRAAVEPAAAQWERPA